MTARLGLVLRLAWRDLQHGWNSTLCLSIAVTAALVPLLLLNGLREGVVTNLIDSLRADPRINEIRLVRDQALSPEWFEELGADPRVGFLLPTARYLAASVRLRSESVRRPLDARLLPTAEGDPLLAGLPLPEGLEQVALAQRVALEADVGVGDRVELIVQRLVGEEPQQVMQLATVVGVVPRDRLPSDDVLVAPALEEAIERWRLGFVVPELGWEGVREAPNEEASSRPASYASFRLYAADLRDVPGLRDRLLHDGLDVDTQASEIEATLAIEAGLDWVFAAVSLLTTLGFLLTLGLHLAASVVEKVRELSLLRLLGMQGWELALLPSIQGMIIAGAGSAAAALVVAASDPLADRLLQGLAGLEGQASRIELPHLLLACALATAAGAGAGSLAGRRAAAVEPARGLRHD